jgi:hypothetical protein
VKRAPGSDAGCSPSSSGAWRTRGDRTWGGPTSSCRYKETRIKFSAFPRLALISACFKVLSAEEHFAKINSSGSLDHFDVSEMATLYVGRVTRFGRIFAHLGECLLLGRFLKIAYISSPHFGSTFSNVKVTYVGNKFREKRIGPHFGPFFYKLVWQPCFQGATAIPTNRFQVLWRLAPFQTALRKLCILTEVHE